MSPEEVRASYAAALDDGGETLTLRRSGTPVTDVAVRGKVFSGFEVRDMAGGVQSARRTVVILAEDVAGTAFATGIKPKSDQVGWGSKFSVILGVGERRLGGVVIAYDLQVSGQ